MYFSATTCKSEVWLVHWLSVPNSTKLGLKMKWFVSWLGPSSIQGLTKRITL